MPKKCIEHMHAITPKWDSMDDTLYELGTVDECVVCIAKKQEKERKTKAMNEQTESALLAFITSDAPDYLKDFVFSRLKSQ